MPAGQGMGESITVDIFQFTTQRHAMGDTGNANSVSLHDAIDKMRGRFSFHGRVGRKNHLP